MPDGATYRAQLGVGAFSSITPECTDTKTGSGSIRRDRLRGVTNLHLRGHVLPAGDLRDVYVVDGRVTFHEPAGGATTVFERGWLTPGLVDAHAHLPLNSPAGEGAPEAERVRASLRVHLDAGVLLVREPGAPSHASSQIDEGEGLPRIKTAGRFIAPPGRYFPGLARDVAAADLARAVTEEAEASGAWVKLVGDFFEPGGRIEPNWETADMRIAADAAHAAGARIAVHATCRETIARAVDAGFDSIEHGHGMTDEILVAMAEAGSAYTPTLSIATLVPSVMAQLGPEGCADMMANIDDLNRAVGAAARLGVTLLAGTDAGLVRHGVVAGEIALLLSAGVPADVALAAGSWGAREYLGYPGIEEGAPADIVAFANDPRGDADELTRPVLVMLGGAITKR
jgi:imidazolonepropionase-like amidohydrolase